MSLDFGDELDKQGRMAHTLVRMQLNPDAPWMSSGAFDLLSMGMDRTLVRVYAYSFDKLKFILGDKAEEILSSHLERITEVNQSFENRPKQLGMIT